MRWCTSTLASLWHPHICALCFSLSFLRNFEQVHDVMGLSLRDGASVFQLECDRSRARYGVILLAFRFDPPVAADVLGELDGIGSAVVVSEC